MVDSSTRTAILLVHCKDQRGLVAAISDFIARHGGNIIDLDQHTDSREGVFLLRAEWELSGFRLAPERIGEVFAESIAEPFDMAWELHFPERMPRMAVFVSRLPHCLYDLLSRCQSGEWRVDVPVVISNHEDLRPVAEQFGVPFRVFPISPANKAEQEAAELELLREQQVDFVVLARYMQVLSPQMIRALPRRIINIHHSFLPAFPGARPYHSAHARGVKIIGASSHYVTEELDAGPIICQDVAHVTHRDSVEDLVRRGRDLEKVVLARAVWHHLQHNVICYGNRTVVFD